MPLGTDREPTEEVSETPPPPAVTATQPEIPEEEKTEVTQPEQLPEVTPIPDPTLTPTPSQAVTELQPSGAVYVPGFGWLESQGACEVIHYESIYERGGTKGYVVITNNTPLSHSLNSSINCTPT